MKSVPVTLVFVKSEGRIPADGILGIVSGAKFYSRIKDKWEHFQIKGNKDQDVNDTHFYANNYFALLQGVGDIFLTRKMLEGEFGKINSYSLINETEGILDLNQLHRSFHR